MAWKSCFKKHSAIFDVYLVKNSCKSHRKLRAIEQNLQKLMGRQIHIFYLPTPSFLISTVDNQTPALFQTLHYIFLPTFTFGGAGLPVHLAVSRVLLKDRPGVLASFVLYQLAGLLGAFPLHLLAPVAALKLFFHVLLLLGFPSNFLGTPLAVSRVAFTWKQVKPGFTNY